MKTLSKPLKISFAAMTVAVVAACIYLGANLPSGFGTRQTTDDAYIAADYTVVAPKVAGFIAEVFVADNQAVHAGQLLARIDDRDYQAALASAQAAVLSARAGFEQAGASLEQQQALIAQAQATVKVGAADVTFAQHDLERYSALADAGAGSLQNAQQARSKIDTAQARRDFNQAALVAAQRQVKVLQALRDKASGEIQRANAELEKARLNVAYTRITAPVDGVVGQRAVRLGTYVNPGSALLAVVPVQEAYVIGNFRETQLTNVRPAQRVNITVDAFPGQVLHGKVGSIAPATGVEFSPVKPSNATGNFTKVVQRIPVKIELDANQLSGDRLRAGMSVVATIMTGDESTGRNNVEKVAAK